MKESLIHKVAFCSLCNKPYIPDIDGNDKACDACLDFGVADKVADEFDIHLDSEEEI